MISICRSFAPWRSSASTAPRTSWSTIASLNREAMMAMRRSRASTSPCKVRMLSMVKGSRSIHVLGHFQAKGRQAVHLLRRAQHAHVAHAEVAQYLRANAVGAEHLRAACGVGSVQRAIRGAHGLGDFERALV